MEAKTNAMRILDGLKLPYQAHTYTAVEALSGVEVADQLGLARGQVFKTLVTVGKSKKYYVFMIPVALELNLKKAALATGEKAIEMIKAKDLLPLTGYVHGGCSPIGMKKVFPTLIDQSALAQGKIFFSAGKIGLQVEMPLSILQKVLPVEPADLT
ncbi:MAG TPA: Cys-tRNA(Pro) deacylase [Candidatus Limiplasma sp.]|nr:Cys-tRNA(Pro) deacylase [Candidatus Limiplasma sp.]HPS81237.1 Cys-tRNA(Pro) deacylase [Candidatus Limiplasma sp.]